jgi:hypothetical protein
MDLSKIGYFIPDVEPLLPNNMPVFWDIWNAKKDLLTKAKKDNLGISTGNDLQVLYEQATFEGMITWMKNDKYLKGSTWKQNVVLDAPEMWNAYVQEMEEKMPWYECEVVVLWAAIKQVHYHLDLAPLQPAPVAIRSLIHDTNPSPTFKLRYNATGEQRHVPYTKERNTFAFNNLKFAHGADYHPEHYKILMKTFGRVKDQGLLLKQIQESKEKGLIWDVEQGVNS